MLKAEEQMELAVLGKHGTSIRELARTTGRSRKTVRRYLRGGDTAATRKAAPKRAEKLDPFKPYIVGRLEAAAPERIPAAVLFRKIQGRGYTGGETRPKQFVRGLAPVPPSYRLALVDHTLCAYRRVSIFTPSVVSVAWTVCCPT